MEHSLAGPDQPLAELHPVLVNVLHRLREAEDSATGPERRAAYRVTRAVLGAARVNGITVRQLADCFGITVGSMRERATPTDCTLSADTIEQLTGHAPAELGELSSASLELDGDGYRVEDFVRTVLGLPIVCS